MGQDTVYLVARTGKHTSKQARKATHMNLQPTQVAHNVLVVGIPPERVEVALARLFVVVLGAVDEAVDVPAHVAPHIVAQTKLAQLVRLLLVPQAVLDQSLHRLRLAVARVLLKDRVRQLDAPRVLLLLVASHHLREHLLLLLAELSWLVR